MANQGKRRKSKNDLDGREKEGQGLEGQEGQNPQEGDTATFALDYEEVYEAEGYRLDQDWEPWEGDLEDELGEEYHPEDESQEDYGEEAQEDEEDYLQNGPKMRNDVLPCENCGEEYSVTYRRCPFCDERTGKKTAPGRGEGYGTGAGMDPRHFLGFSISMVLIFTAGFIVLQEVLPLLNPQKSNSSSSETADPSDVVSEFDNTIPDFDPTQPQDGTIDPEYAVDEDLAPALEFETEVTPDDLVSSGAVVLSSSDVTLGGDESFTLKVTSGGEATWTCSHPEFASVSAGGVVTNLNSSGVTKNVEVTAIVGGDSASCVVRLASGVGVTTSVEPTPVEPTPVEPTPVEPTPEPEPTPTETPSSSGAISTGAATVANASGGVRIRSGPGTEYDALATASNGSTISVVGASSGGWYEITFIGSDGKETGYILGDYIKMD